jgi:hypothetical protein
MARQDKRRGGEPCGPDARGLLTHLRRELSMALFWARMLHRDPAPKTTALHHARAAQLRRNIRWVLAARRAIERAGK